jgi:hypothetical protein
MNYAPLNEIYESIPLRTIKENKGQSIPVQSIPVQSMHVQSVSVQSMPIQSIPVQSFPVQSVAVQSFPVQSFPIQERIQNIQPRSLYQMDHEREIVMRGTNPIRGMYTASYPNACSQYGSSNVNISPGEFYSGTQWCQVGILMNERTNNFNNIYKLEAQFIGNSWTFRALDPIANVFIFLNTVGYGPYGAYRNDDMISIPGKEGLWKVQIQVQNQPYILYVP